MDGTTPVRKLFKDLSQEEIDALYARFVSQRCIACGGNWVAMLESGLKADFPAVWAVVKDTLPDNGHGGIPRFSALAEIIHKCIGTEFDKDNKYLK